MLKSKNIVIIFIVNYLLILLVCCFLEIIFISNHAQQAQLLMRTAADMALEQVQATDDFFVTGGGYLLEDQNAYLLNVCTGQKFEQVELFPAFAGTGDTKDDILDIYTKMFKGVPDFVEENKNMLKMAFVAGNTLPPLEYQVPVSIPVDANTFETHYVTMTSNYLVTNWYYIPKIAQMGITMAGLTEADLISESTALSAVTLSAGIDPSNPYTSNKTLDIQSIIKYYELGVTAKETHDTLGNTINYYFTPISLGITYLNPELLQALFVNNIDLLMRSKYMQDSNYNLNSEENGFGVLKGAFYPELVDTSTLSDLNPINNGAFSFLRGKRLSGTDSRVELYEGTVQPKIEYVVLDMYNNSNINNDVLQQVLGPRFTNHSSTSYAGKEITGDLLYDIDVDNIDNMEDIIYGSATDSPLRHKPFVVAKVTFYADFIIPYSTVSLREMRGREMNNDIGARLLFDAFSTSATDGRSSLQGNYVDLEIRTSAVANGVGDYLSIYPDDYYNDIGIEVNRLGKGYHSDAMTYTTYFAVTP